VDDDSADQPFATGRVAGNRAAVVHIVDPDIKQHAVRLATLIAAASIEASLGICPADAALAVTPFPPLPGDCKEGAGVIGIAGRGRRDTGKLIMVPIAVVVLLYDIRSLASLDALARPGDGALRWAGTALTCLFYALIILCYLRRGPAVATHGSAAGWAVAVPAGAPSAVHGRDDLRSRTRPRSGHSRVIRGLAGAVLDAGLPR
jgi:hypothetical protein